MVDFLDRPRRVRLGDQVAGLLLAAIRLHEYLPGQRLPPERELCLRLGVNRTAVREGLRWLENHQYIEIRRGKYGGAFVRQPGRDLALERVQSRAEQLRQLFEYRALIEPFACAVAAERITAAELERLQALAAADENEPVRPKRLALDVELHQLVADSTPTTKCRRRCGRSGSSLGRAWTSSRSRPPGRVSRTRNTTSSS